MESLTNFGVFSWFLRFLFFVIIGMMSGCGQLTPVLQSSTNPNKFDFDVEYNKVLKLKYSDGNLQRKINEYDNEKDEVIRKRMRNGIIGDFLALADVDYAYFKNGLLSGRAESDTVLDITDLLLSSTGALFGSVTGKANLAAASTILKGSRSAYDKNFFAAQTIVSIINVIEGGRKVDKERIAALLNKDTDEYPLNTAIADAAAYRNRANLLVGALEVSKKTQE